MQKVTFTLILLVLLIIFMVNKINDNNKHPPLAGN